LLGVFFSAFDRCKCIAQSSLMILQCKKTQETLTNLKKFGIEFEALLKCRVVRKSALRFRLSRKFLKKFDETKKAVLR
jgi:hypothetical protein